MPSLSAERRKELAKVAHQYAEKARVSVRNVRRDGMDHFKKMEKDKKISEDEVRMHSDEVQKLTDGFIKQIRARFGMKLVPMKNALRNIFQHKNTLTSLFFSL